MLLVSRPAPQRQLPLSTISVGNAVWLAVIFARLVIAAMGGLFPSSSPSCWVCRVAQLGGGAMSGQACRCRSSKIFGIVHDLPHGPHIECHPPPYKMKANDTVISNTIKQHILFVTNYTYSRHSHNSGPYPVLLIIIGGTYQSSAIWKIEHA